MVTSCYKWYFLIAICFVSALVHAQISVVSTAGTTGPVSYTSLQNAFNAINSGTHQGAISITVTGNTTETASATLKGSGTGTASYTSLLIKPGPATNPIISAAIANPVIILDGARNVTIDGSNAAGATTKNLRISNSITGSSANAVVFVNGASANTIKNAVIESAVTNSGTVVLSNSTGPTGNNHNIIEHNDITKSSGGSPFAGILNIGSPTHPNTRNIFRNNRIVEFSIFGFSDGDDSGGQGFSDSTLIVGNEFYNTTTQPTPLIAIFVKNETGIRNMTISRNKIHSLHTAGELYGILLYDAVSVTIDNNMISLSESSGDVFGIAQETGPGAVIKIYNNTVYITGTTSGTNSFALYKNWFSTNDDFRNNILINTRVNSSGTRGQYAFVKLAEGTFTSDYNNMVSTGNTNNYIAYTNSNNNPIYYSTLAEWQAGTSQDARSISIHPVFVSATDLHLKPADNCRIDNKGTPIAGITADIDENIRSTTLPDMGADEFTSPSSPTTITTQPVNVSTCLQKNATFTVVANGAGTLTYQWRKNAVNIPAANSATYTLSNIVATDAGSYSVVVTGSCDSAISNNATLTVFGPCTAVQAIDPDIDSVLLKPNPASSVTILCVYSAQFKKITWRIIDIHGSKMMEFDKQVYPGLNNIELNLAGFSTGAYYIQGQTSKGRTQVIRLIRL